VWPQNRSLYGSLRMLECIDLRGCRVLDVGMMDGLISFIAEEQGAQEVHATDRYFRPSFLSARDAFASNAEYHPPDLGRGAGGPVRPRQPRSRGEGRDVAPLGLTTSVVADGPCAAEEQGAAARGDGDRAR
jgi:hypothetical protein